MQGGSLALSSADGADTIGEDTIGEDPGHPVIEPSGRILCPRENISTHALERWAFGASGLRDTSYGSSGAIRLPVNDIPIVHPSVHAPDDRVGGARRDQFLRTSRPSGCTPLSARVESASFAVRSPIPT